MVVFLVQHVHEFEDGHEDIKLIGIFSSHEKAQGAVDRVADQPGFKDLPDNFHITEVDVDSEVLGWSEGYVTVT